MNYFQTERKAIYDVASIFTKFNWIFKEQQTVDLGIDAYVETPIDSEKKIKIFALQIKGGDKNFYKKNNYLTFYFKERHYEYWKAISEIHPVLIIIQDSKSNIYWQHFSDKYIIKNAKHWKIQIPINNLLINDKEKIISLTSSISSKNRISQNKNIRHFNIESQCYIQKESKELHIIFKTKNENLDFNLLYKPRNKNWNSVDSFLTWEDPYYYTLKELTEIIFRECYLQKEPIPLYNLISEKVPFLNNGIERIMEYFFNERCKDHNIPPYSDFIEIFKKKSKLKRNQFKVQAIDYVVHFYTKDKIYEIDTYQGLTAKLNYYLKNDTYDEICIETEQYIWSEIYMDPGIEKCDFIPVLQRKWEIYWRELYVKIREEIGKTSHLDCLKEQSLRELNGFINLYNDTTNIIKLAYDYDEMLLYPLVVSAMLEIYDSDVCFSEYCEYLFFASQEWESLILEEEEEEEEEEDSNSEVFFIREIDF